MQIIGFRWKKDVAGRGPTYQHEQARLLSGRLRGHPFHLADGRDGSAPLRGVRVLARGLPHHAAEHLFKAETKNFAGSRAC